MKLGDFGLGVILFDEHEKFSYGGTNQYIPAVSRAAFHLLDTI